MDNLPVALEMGFWNMDVHGDLPLLSAQDFNARGTGLQQLDKNRAAQKDALGNRDKEWDCMKDSFRL